MELMERRAPLAPPDKLSCGAALIEGSVILEAEARAGPRKDGRHSILLLHEKIGLAAKMGECSWNQWRTVSEEESENSATYQTMKLDCCLTPSTKINSK